MTASRCCAALRPRISARDTSTMPLNVSLPSVQLRLLCHPAMLPYAMRHSPMKAMSVRESCETWCGVWCSAAVAQTAAVHACAGKDHGAACATKAS